MKVGDPVRIKSYFRDADKHLTLRSTLETTISKVTPKYVYADKYRFSADKLICQTTLKYWRYTLELIK